MFQKESEMSPSVHAWLRNQGFTVRPEFMTPWGRCDFVAMQFNQENVAMRIEHGQTRPILSIGRAKIFVDIVSSNNKNATSVSKLAETTNVLSVAELSTECERLCSDHFITQTRHGNLKSNVKWLPLHEKLIAVELKLGKIEEVMQQALNNLGFADESYVALPEDIAKSVINRPHRWKSHLEAGVGILSVSPSSVCRLKQSSRSDLYLDKAIQFYSVEKFFHDHLRCNLS